MTQSKLDQEKWAAQVEEHQMRAQREKSQVQSLKDTISALKLQKVQDQRSQTLKLAEKQDELKFASEKLYQAEG